MLVILLPVIFSNKSSSNSESWVHFNTMAHLFFQRFWLSNKVMDGMWVCSPLYFRVRFLSFCIQEL